MPSDLAIIKAMDNHRIPGSDEAEASLLPNVNVDQARMAFSLAQDLAQSHGMPRQGVNPLKMLHANELAEELTAKKKGEKLDQDLEARRGQIALGDPTTSGVGPLVDTMKFFFSSDVDINGDEKPHGIDITPAAQDLTDFLKIHAEVMRTSNLEIPKFVKMAVNMSTVGLFKTMSRDGIPPFPDVLPEFSQEAPTKTDERMATILSFLDPVTVVAFMAGGAVGGKLFNSTLARYLAFKTGGKVTPGLTAKMLERAGTYGTGMGFHTALQDFPLSRLEDRPARPVSAFGEGVLHGAPLALGLPAKLFAGSGAAAYALSRARAAGRAEKLGTFARKVGVPLSGGAAELTTEVFVLTMMAHNIEEQSKGTGQPLGFGLELPPWEAFVDGAFVLGGIKLSAKTAQIIRQATSTVDKAAQFKTDIRRLKNVGLWDPWTNRRIRSHMDASRQAVSGEVAATMERMGAQPLSSPATFKAFAQADLPGLRPDQVPRVPEVGKITAPIGESLPGGTVIVGLGKDGQWTVHHKDIEGGKKLTVPGTLLRTVLPEADAVVRASDAKLAQQKEIVALARASQGVFPGDIFKTRQEGMVTVIKVKGDEVVVRKEDGKVTSFKYGALSSNQLERGAPESALRRREAENDLARYQAASKRAAAGEPVEPEIAKRLAEAKLVGEPLERGPEGSVTAGAPQGRGPEGKGQEVGHGGLPPLNDMFPGFGRFYRDSLRAEIYKDFGGAPTVIRPASPEAKYNRLLMSRLDVAYPYNYLWRLVSGQKGPSKTGFEVKNFFSVKDGAEGDVLDAVKSVAKAVRKGADELKIPTKVFLSRMMVGGKKRSRLFHVNPEFKALYQDLTLVAESKKLTEQVMKEGPQWKKDALNAYFEYRDAALKSLKDTGVIKQAFQERVRDRLLQQMVKEPVGSSKWQAMTETLKLVDDIQFVHLPVYHIFDKMVTQGQLRGAHQVVKWLNRKERVTLTMQSLIDKGILKPEDVPTLPDVMATYGRRVGNDLGLVRIFKAAKEEGFIKEIPKDKNGKLLHKKVLKMGETVLVDPPEAGAIFRGHKAHPLLKDWLMDMTKQGEFPFSVKLPIFGSEVPIDRYMSALKGMQFINPLVMPIYDVWQGVMSTALVGSPRAGYKGLTKTFKDASTRSHDWVAAGNMGLTSKPHSNPMRGMMEYTARIAGTLDGHIVNVLLPLSMPARSIKELYNLNWNWSWSGDRFMRQWTWNTLVKRGWSPQQAAIDGARIHGDYASVPLKTRRILNRALFTPTFKIAMGKLYIDMIRHTIGAASKGKFGDPGVELSRLADGSLAYLEPGARKGLRRQAMFGGGLIGILGINFMFDQMLTNAGFEREFYGRSYRKPGGEFGGEGKDLVVTLAGPPFLVPKYVEMATKAFGENHPAAALFDFMGRFWRSDSQPFWQIMMGLNNNRDRTGARIYDTLDKQASVWQISKYIYEQTIPLLPALFEHAGLSTNSEEEAVKKFLKENLEPVNRMILKLAGGFPRFRSRKEIILNARASELTRTINQETMGAMKKGITDTKKYERMMENYTERLQKVIDQYPVGPVDQRSMTDYHRQRLNNTRNLDAYRRLKALHKGRSHPPTPRHRGPERADR